MGYVKGVPSPPLPVACENTAIVMVCYDVADDFV